MRNAVFALATLILSTSVYASDFRFAYDRDEFATPEKYAAFHERLEDAARSYCVDQFAEQAGMTNARLHADHDHFDKACVTDLVSDVAEKIGDQRLVAYVAGKNGQQG